MKKRYTYIPKEEIESVMTWEGKEISGDKLLDGAYAKGKFAKGGEIEKIKKSIEVLERQGDEKSMMYAERLREKLYEMQPMVTRTQFEEEEFEYARGGFLYDVEKVGEKRPLSERLMDAKNMNELKEKIKKQYGTTEGFKVSRRDRRTGAFYNVKFEDGGMMADGGKVKVGTFDEAQLKKGEDKKAIEKAQKETGLKYIDSKIIKKGGKMFMEVYLTNTFADGGMMADGGITSQMKEAKKIMGEKWDRMSKDDKLKATQYLVMKGDIEGEEEDYEYAKGGKMDVKNPEAMAKAAAIREAVKIAQMAYENGIKASDLSFEEYSNKVSQVSGKSFGKAYLRLAYESMKSTGYADGGMMADGGYMASSFKKGGIPGRNRKRTLEEMAAEVVGSSTWFQLDKETQAGVIAELITEGVLPQRMAKGSKVAEDFSVTYKLADGKSVTEKYSNKDEMDEGIANFYLDNDVLDAIINEAKPKAAEKPAKKSLFDVGQAAPKVTKSKTTAPVVEVPGLEDEIERYDELIATIKNADAEKELIGGKIKEVAKDAYIETYINMGKRPTTITIKSGDRDINYTVQDKYYSVNEDKETVLAQYEGLLGIDYTFTFDKDILDKTGTNGEKIADIINDLIANSEDIPDEYKSKLVKVTKKTGVKSGTIERLLQYDNPAEIFAVIEPIVALK